MNQDIQIEEISLLVFLLCKTNYTKFYKYINKLNFEKETKAFLGIIKSYYQEYPEADHIKVEELLLYFSAKRPLLKKNKAYQEYLSKISTLDINEEILKENLNNLLEKYFVTEIIFELTDVLDGISYGKLDSIKDKIREFDENKLLPGGEASPFVTASLDTLLNEEVLKPGLSWRLESLNKDIGKLRGGTLGHVFARVDTGKTSFIVSEGTNFASQLSDGEIIVWFNNEEKGTRVQLRLYQAFLQCSKDQLCNYSSDAERTFNERGGDKLKIYDNAIISVDDIEAVLKEFNVRLVIIDQGDKVKFNGDKDMAQHTRLKALYGKFRELAKAYGCDILTVGQASAEAEDKKWLRLDYMDNSKTGKPGELDYAIGIGKVHADVGSNGLEPRYLHVCKNKMNDGVHGRHDVYLHTHTATYFDRGAGTIKEEPKNDTPSKGSSTSLVQLLHRTTSNDNARRPASAKAFSETASERGEGSSEGSPALQ